MRHQSTHHPLSHHLHHCQIKKGMPSLDLSPSPLPRTAQGQLLPSRDGREGGRQPSRDYLGKSLV